MIKADKFPLFSDEKPPRSSVSPRPTSLSPIGDRRSPYFRTHSPLSSYESNRETLIKRDRRSPTLAETHLIHKEGSNDSFFSEEHWSSEVSGFITTSPPKFLQVIKSYRVRNTDQFTLLVRVRSDPPGIFVGFNFLIKISALFTWYFNDSRIPINSQTFVIQNSVNASALIVEEPRQGLYACSASNIAGTSKTYGYVTVNYLTAREGKMRNEKSDKGNFVNEDKNVKFVSQVPNLTLSPGGDAEFDIEVAKSNSNTRFSWLINDKPIADKEVEVQCPAPNRCISRFRNARAGKYTIIAENDFGVERSSGYIEVKENKETAHQFLWRNNSYSSDISSNPRSMSNSIDESGFWNGDHLLNKRKFKSQNAGLAKFPCRPKFVQVPSITQQIQLKAGEPLIANFNVLAEPPAEINWYLNKFQLNASSEVKITKLAENSSTLLHKKPQSGVYKIRATNVHGTALYEMRIVVDGFAGSGIFMSSQSGGSNDEDSLEMGIKKPEGIKDNLPKAPRLLTKFPNVHRIKYGQKLTLEVSVDSIPEAKFLWRQNNFELKSGQNIKIESSSNSSKLILEKPVDGRLEVLASNSLGTCSASTKLIIDHEGSKNQLYFSQPLPSSISTENPKQLNVRVQSQEEGKFEWFLDDELLNEKDCKITTGPFNSTLMFDKNLSTHKEVMVSFTNTIGSIKSKAKIGEKRSKEPPIVPKKQFRIVNGTVQKVGEQLSTETDVGKIEIEKSNQDFMETTKIEKQEESYSLLVKVAEITAETLVATIMIDAIREASHRLSMINNSSESEEEDSACTEQSKIGLEPMFINTNETFYCEENKNISINPRLTGSMCTTVQWYKEGQRLQMGRLTQTKINGLNVELSLHNVQLDQAGNYECRVSNLYGVASYYCRLIVRNTEDGKTLRSPSPNYTDTLQNINTNISTSKKQVNQAIEVLLADDVFDFLTFTITEDIEVSAILKLDKKGAQPLTITSTSSKNERNERNERNEGNKESQNLVDERSLKMTINSLKSSTLPSIDENISEISLDSTFEKQKNHNFSKQSFNPDSFSIYEDHDPQKSLLIAFAQQDIAFAKAENLIERNKNGLEILVDSGIFMSLTDSLQFTTSIQPSTNKLTLPSSKPKREIELPRFIEKLMDVQVTERSSPQLTCIASGAPSVKWLFNGKEIDTNSNYKTSSSHGINSLRFDKISIENQGQYTCEISNTNGREITQAYVEVVEAPPEPLPKFPVKRTQSHKPLLQTTASTSNQHSDIKLNPKSKNVKPKHRSKSSERFSKFKINAMDSLKRLYETNIGQKIRRIQERSFSSTRRSRSSQPVPIEARSAPRQQNSSDLESGQWYFVSPTEKQTTENYTIHKYFDSEYKTKVLTAEDRYSTNLRALATDDTTLSAFEHFYKTPSSSTNTIKQNLSTEKLNLIQKYVDSICNFDNLMDWATIASARTSPQDQTLYQHFNESTTSNSQIRRFDPQSKSEFWSNSRQQVYKSETRGQLEHSIQRVEHTSTVEQVVIGNNTARIDEFKLPPKSPPTTRPIVEEKPTSHNQSLDEEESTKFERRILHGRVFPLSGKVSPAPYLIRTNNTCKTGAITDISQEWSLVSTSGESGHAEAFFFPYAQSQAAQSLEEQKPKVKKVDKIEKTEEVKKITEVQSIEDQKLAEFEEYVQRQFNLMNRETQTTPGLRHINNQTPSDGRLSELSRMEFSRMDSPVESQSTYNPIYKIPEEKRKIEETLKYQQPRQFQTLPTRHQKKDETNDLTLLKQTLLEVEKNADRSQRRFHKTVSEDAILIEKAILKVSEELQQRGPLSEAQLLASEELLRSKIAEAILNLKPSIPTGYGDTSTTNTPTKQLESTEMTKNIFKIVNASRRNFSSNQKIELNEVNNEDGKITDNQAEKIDILRDPIIKLKDKLGKLEKQLIYDEEESIREELQQITSMKMEGSDSHDVKMREKSVKHRSDSVARMTPLIVLVKNKLSHLDSAVDQQVIVSTNKSKSYTRPLVNTENSRSIHKLLMNINGEVAKIHNLCKENKKIDSVNLVVEVLAKVCKSIDAILEAFQKSDDLSEISTSLSTTAASPAPATNVSVDFNKPEQVEETNTLLMYWSGGEETTHNLSTKVDAEFKKPPKVLETNANVKVQEFAHVQNKFNASIPKPQPQLTTRVDPFFKKVEEGREEIPEIKLIAPSLASKKSEVRSDMGVKVQNRVENESVETLLQNTQVGENKPQLSEKSVEKKTLVNQVEKPILIVRRKSGNVSDKEDSQLTKSQDEDVSFSENIPILFPNRASLVIPGRETDIISSSDDDQPNLHIEDVCNNVWEKFKLKKHRRNYRVNACIYPAVRFQLIATVSGNDFQVDVDCESEYFYDSVVVLADSFYASQAYVPGQRQRRESSDFTDEDTLEADQAPNLNNFSRMSVSINARSVNDTIQASLEEVPWNIVAATLPEALHFDHFVEARNSGYFNVTVSENQDESKSLKSQESHRSSQKSLAISDQLSQQSVEVPTYIIKQNSTATITVELNPFVQQNAQIEWFRGRNHIHFGPDYEQKYSRVRDDHLEVLVINNVQTSDSELFSITVNKDIYPYTALYDFSQTL